jgi:outer membrane protein assembly factor BamB
MLLRIRSLLALLLPAWQLVCFTCILSAQDFETRKLETSNRENRGDEAANWFQFRGPRGDGTAPGQHPPTAWSETKSVQWKTPIHDRGWSSPVILGDEVWLTTSAADGKRMYVVCIDLASGEIKHDILVFENAEVQKDYHETNSYASPTPVLDGEHVFVHFGSYGTACLRRDTCEAVWQRRDLPCNHFRGPASSPILYKNLLIFHQDGFDFQYVVALDRKTGETIWKADRDIDYGTDDGDVFKAFCTPIIIEVAGQPQLVCPASKACLVLDPATGNEIWRVRYEEFSVTARPLFDGQRLYINTGFGKAQLYCVQADGKGDITDTPKVIWTQRKSIGSKPSQLLAGGRLFSISDDGVLSRLSLENGEVMWQERLGGKFSASLVATDEHLFAFDHDGKGYVFTLADEPQKVAENTLPDGCNASPAIVQDTLVVRTTTHLYRIGRPQ